MPSSISKMGKDEDSLESTESETEAEEAESTETEAASETLLKKKQIRLVLHWRNVKGK